MDNLEYRNLIWILDDLPLLFNLAAIIILIVITMYRTIKKLIKQYQFKQDLFWIEIL